jgi:hypothetical protein
MSVEIDGFSYKRTQILGALSGCKSAAELFTSSLLPFHQEPGKLLQGISPLPKAIQL